MNEEDPKNDGVLIARIMTNELEKLGIDITTEQGRRDFRETLLWARQNKARCEKIAGYSIMLIIGGVATVIGGWLITGAKGFFGDPPSP